MTITFQRLNNSPDLVENWLGTAFPPAGEAAYNPAARFGFILTAGLFDL
ncbi:MAG: hypothetical protein VX304_04170 [Planctomycetota bacterium]|nr:hypothetical protein [Planctomycetota bacterium]